MQYILSEEEYLELKQAKASVILLNTQKLQALCTKIANEMPRGGYVAENGISLCEQHHIDAEECHSNNKLIWEEGFHPDDLYKLINSTLEKAIAASRRLK